MEYVKINADNKIPLLRNSIKKNDKFMELNQKKKFYDNKRKMWVFLNDD